MGASGWTGAVVVAVVLLAGSLFGLWRRASDGVLAPVAGAATGAAGLVGDGRTPGDAAHDANDEAQPAYADVLAALGVDGSAPLTLVQFSTAFCAPCRATRSLCSGLEATTDGVRYIDVDAESHLAAVRALGVVRTPTLLLVDASGRVVRRCVGQPTRAHLAAVVAETLAAVS